MAWTDKANMLLGVNEPARSVDINAIYDNIVAVAEGDPTAPFNGLFINAGTSGDTYIQKTMGGTIGSSSSSIRYVGRTFVTGGDTVQGVSEFLPFVDGFVLAEYRYTTSGGSGNHVVSCGGVSINIPAGENTSVLGTIPNIPVVRGTPITVTATPNSGGTISLTSVYIKTGNNVVCGA